MSGSPVVVAIFSFFFGLLYVCVGLSQGPVDVTEVVMETVRDFVQQSELKKQVYSLDDLDVDCRVEDVCTVQGDGGQSWFLVDPGSRQVAGFHMRGSQIPLKTADGRPVDAEVFSNELVTLSESEARTIASRFVESVGGSTKPDSLELAESGIRRSGPGFFYSFLWTNKANAQGFREGLTVLAIRVNPIDGSIADGSFLRKPLVGSPVLSAEEAEKIARINVGHRIQSGCLERRDVVLTGEKSPEGGGQLMWTIHYVDSCSRKPELGNRSIGFEVNVNDDTGEVTSSLLE
jgi:hypothetical protein